MKLRHKGGRFACEKYGKRPPWAVLLHAGVCDRRQWAAHIGPLRAAGFSVLSYDARGHGETHSDRRPFSHHDDLRAILVQCGITPAVLIGSSQGAMTALAYAAAWPEEVTGLVLAGSGLIGQRPQTITPDHERMITAWEAGDLRAAAEACVRLWGGDDWHQQAYVRGCALTFFENTVHALGPEKRPAPPPFDDLSIPALVMVGEHDLPDMQQAARHLAGRLPNAELQMVAGAGHLINLEKPQTFNRLVLAWLAVWI